MELFQIYDKLSKNDYVQCVENIEIAKREIRSSYFNMLKKSDYANLEKFKDMYIHFVGEYKDFVLVPSDKADMTLAEFIGVDKEAVKDEKVN